MEPPAAASPPVAVNAPPPAVVNMAELYAEAVALSAQACVQAQKQAEDRERELARKTALAQDALVAQVLASAPVAVRAAASQGERSAVVLEFGGGDVYGAAEEEQLSYLYLLKGPRESARRRELTAYGFEPLLMRLRRTLVPFRVDHVWEQATNVNYISVSW